MVRTAGSIGRSANCFRFILGVSLALTLVPLLRRAPPLAPMRIAALGIAALAAFVLQFFGAS
jgi:hypothetical protein